MILGTHAGCENHIVAGMNPYASPSTRNQWYHVICPMYRSRALLKIPATARFCERAIAEACSTPGWTIDTVAATPTLGLADVHTAEGAGRWYPAAAPRLRAGVDAYVSQAEVDGIVKRL